MTDGENGPDSVNASRCKPEPRSTLRSFVMKMATEPLVHFLLIGASLFGVYSVRKRGATPGAQQLVVSAGKIEHLSAIFSRTWQRAPTATELKALVDDYVREEIAYREGMKLGLDEDDTIIRRRIRQKMDFVADDLASEIAPTDAQLAKYLEENRNAYQVDIRLSFKQVFFDPDRHPDDLDESVNRTLSLLQSNPATDPQELGDRTLLDPQFRGVSKRELVSTFGESFADKMASVPIQQWQGPIASPYGIHLIYVEERQEGRLPSLEEVRPIVLRDWEQKRRQELVETFYEGLLKKYQVSIEWPDAAAGGP